MTTRRWTPRETCCYQPDLCFWLVAAPPAAFFLCSFLCLFCDFCCLLALLFLSLHALPCRSRGGSFKSLGRSRESEEMYKQIDYWLIDGHHFLYVFPSLLNNEGKLYVLTFVIGMELKSQKIFVAAAADLTIPRLTESYNSILQFQYILTTSSRLRITEEISNIL